MRASSGRGDDSVTPSPSWPDVFAPQHQTVPSVRRAHECAPPATIASTFVSPATGTGDVAGIGVAVAELAALVRAPAADGRVVVDRAGVAGAGRDRARLPEPAHRRRARAAASAAARPPVRRRCAPSRGLCPPASAQVCAAPAAIASAAVTPLSEGDRRRRRVLDAQAVAELALVAAPPAPDHAVRVERAGVRVARRQRLRLAEQRRHRVGTARIARHPVAELAVDVEAEAEDRRGDRRADAGVRGAGRDRVARRRRLRGRRVGDRRDGDDHVAARRLAELARGAPAPAAQLLVGPEARRCARGRRRSRSAASDDDARRRRARRPTIRCRAGRCRSRPSRTAPRAPSASSAVAQVCAPPAASAPTWARPGTGAARRRARCRRRSRAGRSGCRPSSRARRRSASAHENAAPAHDGRRVPPIGVPSPS